MFVSSFDLCGVRNLCSAHNASLGAFVLWCSLLLNVVWLSDYFYVAYLVCLFCWESVLCVCLCVLNMCFCLSYVLG